MRCSRVLLAARALGSCALLAGARGPCRVGAGWRPFARRLAPFPPSGAQEGAFPLFPRRALKGALCGRFNWGDKGFAQGPRAQGRASLRAGPAPCHAARSVGVSASGCAASGPCWRPVRPRCAVRPGRLVCAARILQRCALLAMIGASSCPTPQTITGQTPRRPRKQGYRAYDAAEPRRHGLLDPGSVHSACTLNRRPQRAHARARAIARVRYRVIAVINLQKIGQLRADQIS